MEITKLQLDRKGQRSKRSQGQRPKLQKLHKNNFAYKEGITQWFYTSFRSKKVHCRTFGGFSPLCTGIVKCTGWPALRQICAEILQTWALSKCAILLGSHFAKVPFC